MGDITEEQLIQTLRNIVHARIVNTRGTEEAEIQMLIASYCDLVRTVFAFGRHPGVVSGLDSGAALREGAALAKPDPQGVTS